MTDARQRLGKTGEDLAVRELASRGYAILARRYRSRRGEIDIICNDHGTIVFVEVRARSTVECGLASESITSRKMRRITACAMDYLSRHHLSNRPCRFDVVAIDEARGASPRITVYTNAFDRVG